MIVNRLRSTQAPGDFGWRVRTKATEDDENAIK